ncbi:MAG TPA: HNH endonuclease signature motif containing protein [Pyrinomonadaceae bacterium]|jgi:hypothetical protein
MNPRYPFVSARARHACEYCRAPEIVFNLAFEVEHITPQSLGGTAMEDNLALSCRSCNLYKADFLWGLDTVSQAESRLFNPRRDAWQEHFLLVEETGEIRGLTAVGRATISRLRINSEAQVSARKQWLLVVGLLKQS